MPWTDEKVAQLRELWRDGKSASQIAAVLSDGITRNAVLGKVARLGLRGAAKKRHQSKVVKPKPLAPRPVPLRAPIIPSSRPAAIEPIVKGQKISLRIVRPDANIDGRSLNAALKALKNRIRMLTDDLGQDVNIDKRILKYLIDLNGRIPTTRPPQELLFSLGHDQELLENYSKIVSDEWPAYLASQYIAVSRAFDRTLRQFSKWREFKRNAERDRLTESQRHDVFLISKEFVDALYNDESPAYVDPKVPETIQFIQNELPHEGGKNLIKSPIEVGVSLLEEDLIVSIDNVVKTLADIALQVKATLNNIGVELAATAKDAGRAYWKTGRKSIVDAGSKEGRKLGPNLVKWSIRVLIGVFAWQTAKLTGLSAAIYRLIQMFPETFSWLNPVLTFLRATVN